MPSPTNPNLFNHIHKDGVEAGSQTNSSPGERKVHNTDYGERQ